LELFRARLRQSLFASFLLTISTGYALVLIQPAKAQTYTINGKVISKKEYTAALLVNECLANLEAGKLEIARIKAEQAKATAPTYYRAHSALSDCYALLGRSEEAITNLRQGLALKPYDSQMLWNLGGLLAKVGNTKEALVTLKQFLAKYPKNHNAQQGKALVSFLEKQIRVENKITIHRDDEYFAEANGINTRRWDDKDIPIKIFIANGAGVRGYQKAFGRVLQESLAAWEEASEGKIKFEQVTAPNQALITFKWSNNPRELASPVESGEANPSYCGNALHSVRVIVLTANFNGEGLSEQAVKFLCIHELGHALGIEGHSLSPKDIMFSMLPYNFENLKLSARDGKTLRKLYSTAIVAPPDEHPDSGAIKRNLAAALNNTGLTALDAQQYDKALDLFQQAQSLNPESKTVRSNIANAHLDCGMSFLRGENFAEAENSLKLAVEEFEAIGNKAMLTRAANNYAIVLKQLGKGDEGKAIKEKYSVAGI